MLLARHPADSPWLSRPLGGRPSLVDSATLASASGHWRSSGSPRAAPRTVASGTSLGSARPVPLKLLALSRAAHRHCPSLPAALWRLGLGHFLENLALGIISTLISTITSRPLKNGISALEHRFGHATGISALERRFGHATTIALAALNLATGSVGCVSCRLSIRGLLFLGLCYCLLGSTIPSRVPLLGLSAIARRLSCSAIASRARLSPFGFGCRPSLLSTAISSQAVQSPLGLVYRLSGLALVSGLPIAFWARLSPFEHGYRLLGSAITSRVRLFMLSSLRLC